MIVSGRGVIIRIYCVRTIRHWREAVIMYRCKTNAEYLIGYDAIGPKFWELASIDISHLSLLFLTDRQI